MCRFHMLLGILCFVVVVECGTSGEGKPTVKFLLSDAKDPDFDLEEFQDKGKSVDDSLTAESIILPTLKDASHPYAVVVLPDLNKFSSLNFGQNEADLGGDGRSDIVRVEKAAIIPKSQEEITKISFASDEITVFPILQASGEKIDLDSLGSQFSVLNDSAEDNVEISDTLILSDDDPKNSEPGKIVLNRLNPQDSSDEIDSEPSASTDSLSPVDDIASKVTIVSLPAKTSSAQLDKFEIGSKGPALQGEPSVGRLFNDDKFKVSEASLERKSRIILKGYQREGDILFSPENLHAEFALGNPNNDKSQAKFSTEVLSRENGSSKSSGNPNNLSIKQVLPIQTLPLVEQFSLHKNVVPPSNEYGPKDLNSVTKNQFATIENARKELIPLLKIKNKQQITESDSTKENAQLQSGSFEQVNPSPAVDLLQVNDYIGGLTKNNILRESVVQQRIPLHELTSAIDVQDVSFGRSNEDISIDSYQTYEPSPNIKNTRPDLFEQPEQENISPEIKEIVHPLLLQILSKSSSKNGSFASNLLEFMKRLPLPDIGVDDSSSANPIHLNVLPNENSISSEQSEQIKQLIKLRNQLNILNKNHFQIQNLQQASSKEVNPERSIGSFRLDNSNVPDSLSNLPLDNGRNNFPYTSSHSTQSLLPPFKTTEASKEKDLLEKGILKNKSKEGAGINWSNFVASESNEYITNRTPSQENKERFNELESIKTPVRSSLDSQIRQEINPNKTFNVFMEKFDVSNALPDKHPSQLLSDENKSGQTTYGEQNIFTKRAHITDNSKSSESQVNPVLSEGFLNVVNEENARTIYSAESLSQTPQPYKLPEIYQAYGSSIKLPKVKIYEAPLAHVNQLPVIYNEAKYTTAPLPLEDSGEINNDQFQQIETIQAYPQETARPRKSVSVTKTSHYAETMTTSLVSTQYPGYQSELRTVSTYRDIVVTDLVQQASIKPTTIITTSYMIHNVLTLDTVTNRVTVTVMKPSAVFFTETDVIKQTEFITFTKTVTAPPQYTVPVAGPRTVTIESPPLTLTKLVNSVSTVTHTLYSTVCGPDSPDYANPIYYTQYNNYGINPDDLDNEYRSSLSRREQREQYFDEFHWPKKKQVWPQGFDVNNYVSPTDSEEIKRKLYNYPSSDLGTEDSSFVMTVALPEGEKFTENRRESRSHKFNHQALVYGTPFYGYKPKNEIYLVNDQEVTLN